jgi:hypothetical protein
VLVYTQVCILRDKHRGALEDHRTQVRRVLYMPTLIYKAAETVASSIYKRRLQEIKRVHGH